MEYRIPLFALNFGEEEEQSIVETLRSRWISTGPKTEEFENRFAYMLNANHAVALANCTAALHLALKILGIKEADEVIVPSMTFVATVNAVRYVGAIPVFCDITSLETPTIDPAGIRRAINRRTKAIIVMHYAGFPCDMRRITEIAREHNLRIVEDACHGPLSEYDGKKLGTIGDIGCFSFFANKNISTGEGGMIVCNDDEYSRKARILRSHGMTALSYERSKGHSTSYDVIDFGFNYRMDDLRAAIGLVQLEKLETDLRRRQEVRRQYLQELEGDHRFAVPFKDHNGFVSNYIFPIVVRNSNAVNRDRIRDLLQVQGIQTSVHYPAVHRFSTHAGSHSLPNTEAFADREITLPMHGKLTKDEVRYVVETLRHSLQ